ncbi:hypothetical protein V8C40DRAFT_30878 [Trichoderma camerunense]
MLLMLLGITSTGEEQLIQVALMGEQGRDEGGKPKRIHVCPAQGTFLDRVRTASCCEHKRLASHSDACGIPMLYVRVRANNSYSIGH